MAQLFPDSGAAGALNDLAILLFVVDTVCENAPGYGSPGCRDHPDAATRACRTSKATVPSDDHPPARQPDRVTN